MLWMEESENETIKELLEFKNNFSLGNGGSPQAGGGRKVSHEDTHETDHVRALKEFHQAFKLSSADSQRSGGMSKTESKSIPKSLDISSQSTHKARPNSSKRKRKKKFEGTDYVFSDVYDLTNDVIGAGAMSKVTVCVRKRTGMKYAVKVVHKSSPEVRDRVLKEVEILYACSSSNLFLHLEDFFETVESFYLVFEKMSGPLLALIQRRERFTEREASLVTREVANALLFLHEQGIAHRDLKPENILCERLDEVVPIRICDFDLSSMISHQTPTTTPNLFTPVGSAEFMAPEVVETFRGDVFSYDKKCDLWSLGVLVYMMLSGSQPFYGHCQRDCGWEKGQNCDTCQAMLLDKITKGRYSYPPEKWSKVSSEAKDLISKLLEVDVEKRLSAKEVSRHPWLEKDVPDTPLETPGILSRNPSIPEELSMCAASYLKCTRRLSTHFEKTRPFALSPPGSSDLALRREHKGTTQSTN